LDALGHILGKYTSKSTPKYMIEHLAPNSMNTPIYEVNNLLFDANFCDICDV
jgi:hypothetical protein